MQHVDLSSPAMNPLWWLVPLVLLAMVLNSPWFKGATGEALVRLSANLRLPSDTYHSFHNVTLETDRGTTQIDHIIVSCFGVFVVETKHMKGWIFGSENDAQWTQRIFRNTFKFQNPLRQNYAHVRALEAALEITRSAIHSVIVFSGEATFKTPLPSNVVRGGEYIRFIKNFRQQVISVEQVDRIIARIHNDRLPATFATRRQHIAKLQSRRREPTIGKSCPRCGSQMVLRTARQGKNTGNKFLGCSSYPRCKAVENII